MKSKPLFYPQETDDSCVPACLRMVFSIFNFAIPEIELRALCDCTIFGTEAWQAVEAARRLGFAQTTKQNLELAELQSLLVAGHFPIVYVNMLPLDTNRSVHALVVLGIEDDLITVYDPNQGERQMPLDRFLQAWQMKHKLTIIVEL